MSGVTMVVDGDNVAQFFNGVLPRQVRRLVRETVYQIAEDIAQDIPQDSSFPHRRTGRLADTIAAVRKPSRGSIAVADVVWRKAFYWRFLEHGQGFSSTRLEFVQHTYDHYVANLGPIFRANFGLRLEALRAASV